MSNPWFRMYAEFAHDPKVQMMPEAMQRRYVMLLCMRCSNVIVTLHETEIAFHLRISESDLADTKALFLAKGFIDEHWNLINWEKRQFKSDSSKSRVYAHRQRKKEASNSNVTLQKRESNALDTDTDTDKPITNPDGLVVSSDAADQPAKPDCPHQKIIDLYHEVLPMCPRVRDWTPARATQLRARWNEDSARQTMDYWRRFFEYVATCDFLVGKTAKPFFADLEWLVKSANFTKIREGKYENRETR